MNKNQTELNRILAIPLSSRGFGYAVMEGQSSLIAYGNKRVSKDKNLHSLAHIEKMIGKYRPDALVLSDVNAKGCYRAPRIKALDQKVRGLARRYKLGVEKISGTELRNVLLGDANGTKQQMSELLAERFPDELEPRLPPKRKPWKSEDTRMDIFDAVALIMMFWMKWK